MNKFYLIILVLVCLSFPVKSQVTSVPNNAVIKIFIKNNKKPLFYCNLEIQTTFYSKNLRLGSKKESIDTTVVVPVFGSAGIGIWIGDLKIHGVMQSNDSINLNVIINDNKNPTISLSGTHPEIFDYYRNLESKKYWFLYYNSQPVVVKSLLSSNLNVDSLTTYRKTFFRDYSTQNKLPAWFLQYEKNSIVYEDALLKLRNFERFNDRQPIKIFFGPDQLIWIRDAKINNREANVNPSYYQFLKQYFLLAYSFGSKNTILEYNSFLSYFPLVEKELDKDILRNYLALQLPDFYKISVLHQRLDSLVTALEPELHILKQLSEIQKINPSVVTVNNSRDTFQCGMVAPEFMLKDTLNEVHKLSDLKGKKVMLIFWSHYFSESLAALQNLAQGVSFLESGKIIPVTVCVDAKSDLWKQTLVQTHVRAVNLITPFDWHDLIGNRYKLNGLPAFVFIDEKGRIVKIQYSVSGEFAENIHTIF